LNNDLKIALVGAAGGIIGGGMVAFVDYVVREREIDVKMVEIAVGLIRQPPTDNVQPAREWAIEVIDHYSDVKLSAQARATLLKCQLDLSDKFGRIGTSATEKAPGLTGGELLLPGAC
jgi:hypothetical protein